MTNGEIARALGIDKANLGRALRGEQRLSSEFMDVLGELPNLRILDAKGGKKAARRPTPFLTDSSQSRLKLIFRRLPRKAKKA